MSDCEGEETEEPFVYQASDVLEDHNDPFDKTAPKVVHNPDRDPRDVDPEAFLPPLEEQMATATYCDAMQLEAVKHIVKMARPLSDAAYPKLVERIKKMGFDEAQLKRTLKYIRDEAPIIIHVKFDQDGRIDKMLKDPWYRNQFETKSSNGSYDSNHSQRIAWEDRLFNNIYHDATPFQRPKYGCLNIVKDPKGIKSAYHYGDSYFILKKVRLRCSFTDQDSSASNCELSSCEYYNHVLLRYNDQELRSVIRVANGLDSSAPSDCIQQYKEIQFHGSLPMAEVIQEIVLNSRHKSEKGLLEKIEKLCVVANCSYRFFD
eukprot:PhF_6_TR1404/c0_g1_i1/m.2439